MATYKEQNKLNVPHLRFPEFHGEWEKCKVSDLLDFYSTNSLSWDQLEYGTDNMLNLHYGLIHVGLPTMVDLSKDILPAIKKENEPKNFELCKEGDIAFADASEDTNEVAKAIEFYTLEDKAVVCGLHTIHGRDKSNKTVVGYKGYAFSSTAFHHQIRRIAQGTKIYSISAKNFAECYIGIPSKEEQTKIAKLLRLIDERIATQSKLIEDLKKLKSAIIDYAINSLDSGFVKFGSLYEMAGEGGTPTTSNVSFYDNGKIPFIKIDDLKKKYLTENKDFITELGLQKSSAWLVPTRSILFSNGATIGEITITTYPVCTKQGILGIVPKPNVDVEFLYYFMSSSYFKKAVSRIVTEGTMKTAYLKDINNILCPIPIKEEQQEIAKMPSALNSKLDIEQSILKLFGSQKQYLLRQMFM
ncbi:restriction endonuclease subunit S [Segatella copri]|uniref:restriction endonuclease subunit S n=1 Tax=Segatella copri TaxID=165179 RepID=UPI002FEF8059